MVHTVTTICQTYNFEGTRETRETFDKRFDENFV